MNCNHKMSYDMNEVPELETEYSKKQNEGKFNSSKEVVMIVDDDPLLAELFQEFFILQGVPVRSFTNPLVALNWYGENYQSVGMIFLDIEMPELSGPECLHDIARTNSAARVAFVSGAANTDLISDLMRKPQVYGFFPKPADYMELVSWSCSLLESVRAT